jgi:two-component system sensor histidine kinase YesM
VAQLNNVPQISDTVTALASLMEASIARGGKFVTLGDEIGYIDDFILILKQRFGDRMEFEKNIDESVLTTKIPRLLIQPLIENAANHGVANIRGKGIVKLSVKGENSSENGKYIEICIEDNGAGISKDELFMLNERLSMNDEDYFSDVQNKQRSGIGIENVNRRIKLFYGQKYGLKIESEEGKFTRIEFKLPLEIKNGTQKTEITTAY